MASQHPTITTEQYEAISSAKHKQVDNLQAQLQDYANACQRLENALIQEQLRTKQLLDDIHGYKAMLTLKDTQLEELRLRLTSGNQPCVEPGLMVVEKEIVTYPLGRSVSASLYQEKEVLPPQALAVPQQQRQTMGRPQSFSDKLPVVSQKQHSRASSMVTFDALGIPAAVRPRNSAAELKEPKGYSAKANLRYFGGAPKEADSY